MEHHLVRVVTRPHPQDFPFSTTKHHPPLQTQVDPPEGLLDLVSKKKLRKPYTPEQAARLLTQIEEEERRVAAVAAAKAAAAPTEERRQGDSSGDAAEQQ
jgi:hypothetical protein